MEQQDRKRAESKPQYQLTMSLRPTSRWMNGPRYESILSRRVLLLVDITTANMINARPFTQEPAAANDLHLHAVGNSWVESTMEMSLRDLVDAAHQGGHPHGSFFGNGKL